MKKSINKLSLNKMTITNLSDAGMNQVNGGVIIMKPLTSKCPSTKPATCSVCNCNVKLQKKKY